MPKNLVGYCSKRDPFLAGVAIQRNSHFVQRCTSCRIIWNRDYNASRNQIFIGKILASGLERPNYFRQPLSKPEQTAVTQ